MENDGKLFIKDLNVRTKRGYLCVRVMRKWNYDGNIPGGRVFYIGLLFADEQGQAIYGQIPESEVQRLGPQLCLDKVYTLRRFNVRASKAGYVPFDAGIMLQITAFTTITPSKVPVEVFPKILYQITPFHQIKTSGQATTKYIDVLGILTNEDSPKTACPKGKEYVSTLKEVTIKDLSGAQLTVTLWENHVQQFQIKDVSPTEPAHSVVVLFCGCLPKKIFNKTQVNAGNACRWFLNPDIPEAQPLYDMLKREAVPIQRMLPIEPSTAAPSAPRMLEHKTLAEMNAINPYDFPDQGCKCTVTITQIPPDQEWWYMGCEVCKRRLRNNGGTYYCTKCNTSIAIPLYKLTFVGADETAEARFFCYDVNARQIIRRNCDSLLRSLINVSALPDAILRSVGRAYTFAVGLTEQSYNSMATRAYLVESLTYKPTSETTAQASSSAQGPSLPLAPSLAHVTQGGASVLHGSVPATVPTEKQSLPSSSSELLVPETVTGKVGQNIDVPTPQTPPPEIEEQETPVKAPKTTNTRPPEENKLRRENVRKRLFAANAVDNEGEEIDEDSTPQESKANSKKKKATSAGQEIKNSNRSKASAATSENQVSSTKDSENL